MPPKYLKSNNPDAWWQQAYDGLDHIHVQYELEFGRDLIKPGTKIKIKNLRGEFKFRCLAHNANIDVTWFDCIDTTTGEWRSFYISRLKCVVKPKRSRRHKPNV